MRDAFNDDGDYFRLDQDSMISRYLVLLKQLLLVISTPSFSIKIGDFNAGRKSQGYILTVKGFFP